MIRKATVILILLSVFCYQQGIAQKAKPDYRKLHYLSEEEMYMDFDASRDFFITDPPSGAVRNVAEFEEMQSVLVRYPLGIPVELVREMAEDTRVLTIVSNTSLQQSAVNEYQNAGTNMSNCDFLIAPSDSKWTRDYGPWFVFDGNDQPGIVNFPYNRPRPYDNDVPIEVSDYLGIDLYGMNLETAGGNYMCDGMGKAAATDLIWEENTQYTHTEIDELVEDYLGIQEYFVTDDPLDDYIKHIDCWGKFLSPGKILIGQVPTSDYRYADFEAIANLFANEISSFGVPYEVFRVYTPGTPQVVTPYTNSLILNKKVLVPITGNQWDDEALESYETAMPGYEIVGIMTPSSGGGNAWVNTDALHCRTKGIADIGMLYFHHIPVLGELPYEESVEISTQLIAYSGEDIYTDSVFIIYNVNNGVYDSVLMTHQNGNTWTGTLNNVSAGDEIDYYLFASDESGRQVKHPYIGEPDPHEFSIAIPPEVYDISFWCSDASNGDPLEGVYVSINGSTLTSDQNGFVLFEDYAPDTYNYIAFREGYITQNGTVTVTDANVEAFIELSPEMLFDISFWCTEADNGNALPGVYISISGVTIGSDEDGLALFEDYEPGDYEYTAFKDGFITQTGAVTITDQDIDEFVVLSLAPVYDIMFWCSEEGSPMGLSGVNVTIGTTTIASNSDGLALFENYEPGDYNYSAAKEGYTTQIDMISLIDDDLEEFVVLSAQSEEIILDPDTVLFLEPIQMEEGIALHISSNMDVPVLINSITDYGEEFPWYVEEMPELPYQLMEGSSLSINIMVHQLVVSFDGFYSDTLYVETDNNTYKGIIMIDSTLLLSSVNEKDLNELAVYPNPFKDYLNIEFYVNEQSNYEFSLYDVSGRMVDQVTGFAYSGYNKITWKSENSVLKPGYYLYKLEAGELIKSGKIILNR